MLQTSPHRARATDLSSLLAMAFVIAISLLTPEAHAQIAQAQAKFTMLQVSLVAISVVTATLAFMFVGYRMMFQAARFADVWHVVIGAGFVAMSTALAAWAVS